jgi:hypothetical protein
MKYRLLSLLGLLALGAGSILQAQDYDDIYYDASKSQAVKVVTPAKTVSVYGEVPETYKVAASSNYRVERDVDEYNRRGAYDPTTLDYEVDINGDTIYIDNDTIYEETFANTRRIERFYNPDIVILSDDDDLVELYYDESPTINLVIGSDWGYGASYGWSSSYYYPWYTGWYEPWYTPYYYYFGRPYYGGYWSLGWNYWHSPHMWHWSYWRPYWGPFQYGWDNYGHYSHNWLNRPVRGELGSYGYRSRGGHVGLANNRNGRTRVNATGKSRNGIAANGGNGNRPTTGVGTTSRNRGGYAGSRSGGNMGSRGTTGVTTRSSGATRSPSYNSGTRGSSYNGGSRSSGYSGGSRSSGSSYSGGSRSSGGSYSGGSRSSGGSYSGGSSGGSRSGGGASGGGGRRR